MNLADILTALPLFHTLEPTEVVVLLRHMVTKKFTAKQALLTEGQPPSALYVLISGKVAVMKHQDHIVDLDAGECVGEVEIIDDSPCAASVVCLTDVETAALPKQTLESYFAAQPAAASKILRQMVRVLASRLRQTNASYSSMKRLAESMDD
jgi:CRP-like cAMP-binding protein